VSAAAIVDLQQQAVIACSCSILQAGKEGRGNTITADPLVYHVAVAAHYASRELLRRVDAVVQAGILRKPAGSGGPSAPACSERYASAPSSRSMISRASPNLPCFRGPTGRCNPRLDGYTKNSYRNDFPDSEGDSPIFPTGKSGQSPSYSLTSSKRRRSYRWPVCRDPGRRPIGDSESACLSVEEEREKPWPHAVTNRRVGVGAIRPIA